MTVFFVTRESFNNIKYQMFLYVWLTNKNQMLIVLNPHTRIDSLTNSDNEIRKLFIGVVIVRITSPNTHRALHEFLIFMRRIQQSLMWLQPNKTVFFCFTFATLNSIRIFVSLCVSLTCQMSPVLSDLFLLATTYFFPLKYQ